MKAKLIGERSAGMTAVEIYDDAGNLVWSHLYFENGATSQAYINGLCQAWDDMRQCADVADYEGGYVDEDGAPVLLDDNSYTGIMLEFDSETNVWAIGDDARSLGQSREIVDACMVAGLIPADEDHADLAEDDVVQAIARYIEDNLSRELLMARIYRTGIKLKGLKG